MRTLRLLLCVTLAALFVGCAASGRDAHPAAAAQMSPAKPPLAVFVVGTHHYNAHESMPVLADQLQQRYGWRVKVVTTDYDPEHNPKGVPGLEALREANVAVLFMRFLTLPPNQLAQITDYLHRGKPIVALRTTNHAFDYPVTDNRRVWNEFGQQVLGTAYHAHLGDYTDTTIAPGAGNHPILTGFPRQKLRLPSQLYKSVIPDDATPLLIGQTESDRRVKVSQFGWNWFAPVQSYPIAWTWKTPAGSRVFHATLGSVDDLKLAPVQRLIHNAIHWAADLPVPRN